VEGLAGTGSKPWKFFWIAYGISWAFWIPAALIPGNIMESRWVILLYLGGLGPAAAAVILVLIRGDRVSRKEYWSRLVDYKRIDKLWFPIIFFGYPVISLIATWLVQGRIGFSETIQGMLAQPLQFLPFLVFLYLFGPLPEELGWRGYALDGLQERINPAWSSLLLGFFHAIWHIPLFLMSGTYQFELGFGSAEFWVFMFSAVVVSVFYTWIYNHNQNSILSATLFHFSINLTGNVFQENLTVRLIRLLIMVVLAGGLILIPRSKGRLGYQRLPDK
jgi:membrane protease YdiL (CAAX protease family)